MPRNNSKPMPPLSEAQLKVIELLEAGFNLPAAAILAGVSLPTIRAWLHWVPAFLAELRRRHDERTRRLMREEVRDQIHKAAQRRLRAQDLKVLDQALDRWISDHP